MNDNRQGLCNWATRLAAAWFVLWPTAMYGQQPAWKTGPALRRELAEPIGLTWGARSAREALAGLSTGTGVAIFLDRRIDPDQTLDLKLRQVSLADGLKQIADQLGAGVALVDAVVYVGPREAASKLASLAAARRDDAQRLPPALRSKWLARRSWQWEELAEPRTLLAELAGQGGVSIENAELVPHDLWPAGNLPALVWTDRLTLLLAGFNLTFEPVGDGRTIRLGSVPDNLAAQTTLPESPSPDDNRAPAVPGEKRYTLTVQRQPAGAIVKTVAAHLGIEMKFDAAVGEKLKSPVSFQVKDVPLAELLSRTLGPLGLTYKLNEQALEVMAK
ncbi:MAG: hypothetical protein WD872_01990 [Pirellulaceae bacterium]